jgi:hypothetical protein
LTERRWGGAIILLLRNIKGGPGGETFRSADARRALRD